MKKIFLVLLCALNITLVYGQNDDLPPPFEYGSFKDIDWEVRFNLPECDHEGQALDAWCLIQDYGRAAEISGVHHKLESLMNNPDVKSLYLAYFSFSNKTVRKALCKAAIERNINITVYIDQSNLYHANVEALKNCSENIQVIGRGVNFGTPGGHLQHAKIFLATSMEVLKPLHELSHSERKEIMKDRIYFTSSSANMSSNGTALHFENWLFFDAPLRNHVAQQNVCTFMAFEAVDDSVDPENDRNIFADAYEDCVNQIQAKPMRNIKFYMVPANEGMPKPLDAMKEVADVNRELLVGIHRLTSWPIYSLFTKAKRNGADVRVIFDDDTLRAGVEDGGEYLDMGKHDVKAYRSLRDAGVRTYFMETNYGPDSPRHVFHNKFVVGDNKKLFQGAGNFTSSALNIANPDYNPTGFGNYEQFYYITVPEIVQAYREAWKVLKNRASIFQDHPVSGHEEIEY